MARPQGSVNKVKTLSDDPKLFGDWLESAKYILEEKKKELDFIQHNITLATIELRNVNEAAINQKAEWEREKRKLKQDFDNDLNLKRRKLDEDVHRIEFGTMEHEKRMEELQAREAKVLSLEDEKKKLSKERIEVEKLNINLKDLQVKTKEKFENADDKLHKVSLIKETNDKKEAELKLKESSLIALDDALKTEKQVLEKEKSNIEKVRNEIIPLVETYKKQENSLRLEREKLEQERLFLQDKIAEERNMLSILDEEKHKLDTKKRDLAQKEEELKRFALLNKKE